MPLSRSGQTMHVSDDASLPSESFSAIRRHTRPPGAIPVASLPPEGAIGLTLKFVRKPRCSSESSIRRT